MQAGQVSTEPSIQQEVEGATPAPASGGDAAGATAAEQRGIFLCADRSADTAPSLAPRSQQGTSAEAPLHAQAQQQQVCLWQLAAS